MIKNLRKLVLAILAITLTAAFGVGAATLNVSADETAETVKSLKGYNVTLKEDIALKYHFIVPAGYDTAEIAFTLGEGGSTIAVEPKTGLTAGEEVVFVLDDIAPDDMTKTVTARVIWTGENGKTGVEEIAAHSVKGYLETLLKNALNGTVSEIDTQEKYDALKALVSSVLYYGDAAQTYTGAAANSSANLTTSEKNAVIKANASSSDLAFEGTAVEGLAWTGATLVFGDKVDVKYFFKATAEFKQGKTLGAIIEGEFVEAEVYAELDENTTEYSVVYEGLSVTEFDKVLSATVAYKTEENLTPAEVGKTVRYSVKSYVNRINASDSSSNNMKALASAAYSYGVAVSEYLSALNLEKDYNGEKITLSATTDTSTFENYLKDVYTYGLTPKYDISYINKNGMGKGIVHAAATDGKYMYLMSCNGGKAIKLAEGKYYRSYIIIKFDPAKNEVIGKSAEFDARTGKGEYSSDDYLICYYKDGYIYAYDKEDQLLSVSVDGFNSSSDVALTKAENAPAFALDKVAGIAYKDGYYALINESNSLSIYSEDDTNTAKYTVSISGNVGANSKRRITSCGDYIYVLRQGDGVLTPIVSVVNWKGEKLYNLTVPVTKDLIGLPDTVEVTKEDKTTGEETTETVTTTSFNIQNFVVIDGVAYSFGYVWQSGYGRMPLFTINGKEQSLYGEYHTYSLAERSLFGFETQATTTLAKTYGSGLVNGNFVYAAATDGKYAYFVGGNDAKTAAYITKYDLTANKKIASSASIGAINESEVYAFVKDGFIYVYSKVQNKVFRLPVDFIDNDTAAETELTFDGISGMISGAYYSRKRNEYAVLAGDAIHVYGEDMVKKYSFSVPSSMTVKKYDGTDMTASTKTLSGEDDYLYVCYYVPGSVTPGVVAYSFTGEKVYSGVIENDVHNKTTENLKLETMISVDGALYFTILSWSGGSGTALFKTTFNSTKEETVSASLGEYYEKSGTIALSEPSINKLTGNGVSSWNHGFITDGVYGYMSVSSGAKNAASAKVVKFNLETNTVVGLVTAPLKAADVEAWNYGHNLFIYGNDIYLVVKEDKATYKIDTDEFDTTGKKAMTEVTGFFGGETTCAEAAYYDETGDRFAVRVGKNLYVGKKDSLKKVSSTMDGKLAGIYGDSDYIYVLGESGSASETCSLKIEIYDWNGNKITKTANTDFKPMNGVKSNNVQGFFVTGGKYYFLVCQWDKDDDYSVTGGAFIVSGYLDYSLLK